MATKRAPRPRTLPQVGGNIAMDAAGQARAVSDLTAHAQRSSTPARALLPVDLSIGDNVVNHGLGRVPVHVNLMPTAVDASFAWAVTARNAKTITVAVAGLAQTSASLEVF